MKKNLFYYLFAVICTIGLFTSCSDDDEKVVNPIPQTTFNSENGLQLTYNGAPLLGKKVTFTPDATEATKATLRLEGEFDLAGILKGQRSNMTSPTGPGVFPGKSCDYFVCRLVYQRKSMYFFRCFRDRVLHIFLCR